MRTTLRVTVLVGAWLDLLAAHFAGSGTSPGFWVVATAAAALVAIWPDSPAGLLLLGLLLGAWLGATGPAVSGWILLGVAGVVAAHVAAVLLTQGPREAAIPAALVRLWARRCTGLWLLAAALWLISREATAPGAPIAPSVVLSALLVLAVVALWLGGRLSTSRGHA